MQVLVTGGCGFIGKNFIRFIAAERPEWHVVNLDVLTYAGTTEGLPSDSPKYEMIKGDIRDTRAVKLAMTGCNAVVNFAAESHVDRSIMDSGEFISTNVGGTQVLLDSARRENVAVFMQISTDEVYGSLRPSEPPFTEGTQVAPRSPYAASKAAADHLALAYFHTYGLDVRITRCSNNYGPYQFPEKLIPLTIINALEGKRVPVYGDGRQRRDWIHVEDHCRAILRVLEEGRPGEIYNVGANQERENIEVVQTLLASLGADQSLIQHVKDRPGHDRRYAMNASKIKEQLGWASRWSFDQGMRDTVRWYQRSRDWWEAILKGTYRDYYRAQYGNR